MMNWIGYIAYQLGVRFYWLAVQLAAFLGNAKAQLFLNGRKTVLQELEAKLTTISGQKAWFHCASLGEFEQARPIIETFKSNYPTWSIVLTFFSPSGYEIRKNYPMADAIVYLPMDSKHNAERFISIVNPSLVFFVKYEVWYHYLKQLNKKQVPTFLLSANFRTNHIYFKWYGMFFKKMLHQFTHIFTQNEFSALLLNNNGITDVSLSNDTRFDRVFQHAATVLPIPLIKEFKNNQTIMIAGSSYEAEEKLIADCLHSYRDWKLIVAPHQIDPSRIEIVSSIFGKYATIKYSQLLSGEFANKDYQVLIIDNIGLLASAYQYADCAFIGGGFGKSGLHNMLEAAAFGLPVMIGPNNHAKFPESLAMIAEGIAFSVKDSNELLLLMNTKLDKSEERKLIHQRSKNWVQSQVGAKDHIFNYLMTNHFLDVRSA